jgi:hypothetical protein
MAVCTALRTRWRWRCVLINWCGQIWHRHPTAKIREMAKIRAVLGLQHMPVPQAATVVLLHRGPTLAHLLANFGKWAPSQPAQTLGVQAPARPLKALQVEDGTCAWRWEGMRVGRPQHPTEHGWPRRIRRPWPASLNKAYRNNCWIHSQHLLTQHSRRLNLGT